MNKKVRRNNLKSLLSRKRLRAFVRWLPAAVNAMPARARLLLFVLVLVIIVVIWLLVVYLPMYYYRASLLTREQLALDQISVLSDQARLIVSESKSGDNAKNANKHKELQDELKKLDETLVIYRNELVPADKMNVVLRDILQKAGHLKMTSFAPLATEKVTHNSEDVLYQGKAIYRRGVKLTFQGDYESTYKYLKELEQSQWRFVWDSLTYAVSKYPEATISLTVETLSTDKGPENLVTAEDGDEEDDE